MDQSDKLKVENSIDLLLVLLFAPGKDKQFAEAIEGITRLQKLMFLLQQGKGPQTLIKLAEEYGYKPYKMGPYSENLREDIDNLIAAGIVKTERLKYLINDDTDGDDAGCDLCEESKEVESLKFSLTEKGKKAGKELWESLNKKEQNGLSEFKSFFCSLTLRQLLIFVYDKFPKYAEKSEIRRKLGL
ncbi:MAG: hypothetical protein PHY02_05045 [Phycisphaerae bacterium]|nr:hypothetical protein [Phycisphaerae bacterium]